jgi:ribonuclease-3
MPHENPTELERILGYHFFEREHLVRALTHPAYANEQAQQNRKRMDQEAYSTLGDAVLKTVLILFLMERGVQSKGEITVRKETLENNCNLAVIGKRLEIRRFILLGKGEAELWRSGEQTILSDTVEALIGAIFLDSDGSFGIVRQCIGKWFGSDLEGLVKVPRTRICPAHTAERKPSQKKAENKRADPVKKRTLAATAKKERITPRPVIPLLSSFRRGPPRGKRRGLQPE